MELPKFKLNSQNLPVDSRIFFSAGINVILPKEFAVEVHFKPYEFFLALFLTYQKLTLQEVIFVVWYMVSVVFY